MPTVDVQALKSRVDLVELFASRGLKLIRRGANFSTLCPWHNDTNPSLIINPRRQLWRCFGCQAAGDALSFVERFDKVDFTEALARLDRTANTLPSTPSVVMRLPAASTPKRRPRNADALEAAIHFYELALPESAPAAEFLARHGITRVDLLAGLRIGYADGGLLAHSQTVPDLTRRLFNTGIVDIHGTEIFSKCLVFPLFDGQGRPVDLHSVSTQAESQTPHRTLPGPRHGVFNRLGLKHSTNSVILTEDLIDALSLLQLGFRNTTCTWGLPSFFDEFRAALQQTKTRTVFIAYGQDSARDAAASELAGRLAPHGIVTRRVRLPTPNANAFLTSGRTKEEFQAALDCAAEIPIHAAPIPAATPAAEAPPSRSGRSRAPRPLEPVVVYYQKVIAKTPEAADYLRARGLTHATLLNTVRVGFSDGSLKERVAARPALAQQLQERGVLNERGNEMLYRCLVFPILDPEGRIVNLYGRNTRPDTEIPHLYLPGPRKGVFNYPGLKGANGSVILTEGIIDALSLLQLGFANTTCAWGTNGFTADILAALQRTRIQTVFVTYDNDPAGNPAAEQLAYRLAPHGITTKRVSLPEKDPNAFLVAGHTADEFAALLATARDLTPASHRPRLLAAPSPENGSAEPATNTEPPTTASSVSGPPGSSDPNTNPPTTATTPADSTTEPAEQPPPEPAPEPGTSDPIALDPANPQPSSLSLVTRFGARTYRMAPPRFGSSGLRVTLRLELDGKAFLHRFDLTNDSARSFFVGRAAKLFPSIERRYFEEDLFALIDQLEERQLKKENSKASFTPQAPDMSAEEEADALAFLKSPTLLADLVRDLELVGLVGEIVNKVLLYLIATSRLLLRPLSAVLLSGSSAGKSFLLKLITDLMPPEQVFRYTRISAQALFYKETDALKHKLVLIEEAEGANDADYPLRVMQSDRSLKNLVTIKDPATGQMTTQETEVEGPIALLVSSTAASINYENATRSFELGIDESAEQTAQILAAQRKAKTLAGLLSQKAAELVRRRHQNAQRLLASLTIANPYAELLTFPTEPLRLRREQEKYLTLIEAVTFLHQHQRPRKSATIAGSTEPVAYINTTKKDIKVANRLFATVFADTVGELSRQSRCLLARIAELLRVKRTAPAAAAESVRADLADPAFPEVGLTRREIREAVNWSDYQLRICLAQLEDLEYLQAVTGRQGKRYLFALTPKGAQAVGDTSDPDALARQFGLIDPDSLPDLED